MEAVLYKPSIGASNLTSQAMRKSLFPNLRVHNPKNTKSIDDD